MRGFLTVIGVIFTVVALIFGGVYLYSQTESIRLTAQANADRAQAQADQAAAHKALAEGEKILASGEADAIRAPAEAAARAVDRQSLVLLLYGTLTPVLIGISVLLAIIAGMCFGVIVGPRLRVWNEARKIEYE